jgi:hypothetical protein
VSIALPALNNASACLAITLGGERQGVEQAAVRAWFKYLTGLESILVPMVFNPR